MFGLKLTTFKTECNTVALLLKNIWTENGRFPVDARVIDKI